MLRWVTRYCLGRLADHRLRWTHTSSGVISERWGNVTERGGGQRRVCAAIVDRLTFGGNIIETGTDSYRPAQAHQKNIAMATD